MEKYEKRKIVKWEDGELKEITDDLVVETSLEISVENEEVVTTLCSPGDEKALAVGFLSSEGIIDGVAAIEGVVHREEDKLVKVSLSSGGEKLEEYFQRKRALTSSCGRARAVIEKLERYSIGESSHATFEPTEIVQLMKALQRKSELFQLTGGSHTAALASAGELLYLAEDIGRHNAVDKAIGKGLLSGRDLRELVLLTSGRLSSEMVLKAVRSSIPILVSRSASTTLATRIARLADLTIIGFTRGNRMTIYSGEERLDGPEYT